MDKYFSQSEQENYISNYGKSIDCVVRKSKEFKFNRIIELIENDLFNSIPNESEEMFLKLNFETGTYKVILSSEQPTNTIKVTENGNIPFSDFNETVYVNGTAEKYLFRIV